MDPLYLVRLAGIEPTTPWFVAKYSIQLSYSREEGELYRSFQILQTFFNKTEKTRLFSIAALRQPTSRKKNHLAALPSSLAICVISNCRKTCQARPFMFDLAAGNQAPICHPRF